MSTAQALAVRGLPPHIAQTMRVREAREVLSTVRPMTAKQKHLHREAQIAMSRLLSVMEDKLHVDFAPVESGGDDDDADQS